MDVVGGHWRSQWVRRALPHFLAEGGPVAPQVAHAAPSEEDNAGSKGREEGAGTGVDGAREQRQQQADDDGAVEGQGQVAHHLPSTSVMKSRSFLLEVAGSAT